jgi:hypothetical protein
LPKHVAASKLFIVQLVGNKFVFTGQLHGRWIILKVAGRVEEGMFYRIALV